MNIFIDIHDFNEIYPLEQQKLFPSNILSCVNLDAILTSNPVSILHVSLLFLKKIQDTQCCALNPASILPLRITVPAILPDKMTCMIGSGSVISIKKAKMLGEYVALTEKLYVTWVVESELLRNL